jgi:predicted permease
MRTACLHHVNSVICRSRRYQVTQGPFRRRRIERQLDDELRYHFDRLVADGVRAGMSHEEAQRIARLEFGGVMQTKEACREVRGWHWLDTLAQDLRYGGRMLARNPGFSIVAVTALALGIAANVVIFSLANMLIFRPLPVTNPDQLIRAYTDTHSNTAYADYLEYRDHNRTLAGLAAFQLASVSLRSGGAPEHVYGMAVSGNYFDLLGVGAARGRAITREDDRTGAPGVVVLSDGFWRRRFGGDAALLGHTVTIDGHAFTVIGIAPSGFTGTMAPIVPDTWVAWNAPGVALTPEQVARRTGRSTHMIGRLRPGVSRAQAEADLATLASALAQEHPDTNRGSTVTISPARTLSDDFGPGPTIFVGFLMAVVGLVLFIACINIASLLLARSAARRREIATRLALGAGRQRLIRQLLTESLLLSACGGGVASVIGLLAARAITVLRVTAVPIPVGLDLAFDWRVIAFAVGLSLLTTVLFGLIPALQASKSDVIPALKDGTAAVSPGKSWLRASLLAAQVAMSTLLLVTAGLLVRSLSSAHTIDRGFSGEHVLAASLDLETRGYNRERGTALYEQLLSRLAATPGIVAANLVNIVPLTLSNQARRMLTEGQDPPQPPATLAPIYINNVSPGHFRTLSIPLLAGRDFSGTDRANTPDVVIVNETLAHRMWPGESPIGKRLREWDVRSGFGPWLDVVGLARDSKYVTVGESPKPFLYRPLAQAYRSETTLLVRVIGDPLAAFPAVRDQVQALDPDLPLFGASRLDAQTRVSLVPVQVAATLAGTLGVVALALAAIGLYGVMSYVVRQRTREIGLRMALGAQSAAVVSFVTRQGMRWTSTGIVLGLGASWIVARLLAKLLYGISAADPVAFLSAPLLLAGVAYAACFVPGRRASRLDPLAALREE